MLALWASCSHTETKTKMSEQRDVRTKLARLISFYGLEFLINPEEEASPVKQTHLSH